MRVDQDGAGTIEDEEVAGRTDGKFSQGLVQVSDDFLDLAFSLGFDVINVQPRAHNPTPGTEKLHEGNFLLQAGHAFGSRFGPEIVDITTLAFQTKVNKSLEEMDFFSVGGIVLRLVGHGSVKFGQDGMHDYSRQGTLDAVDPNISCPVVVSEVLQDVQDLALGFMEFDFSSLDSGLILLQHRYGELDDVANFFFAEF